jgi:CRISPR-associated endonuclease Cas2
MDYNRVMGELEISLKKEIKIGKLQKAILGTVAAAGLLSVAMVAPGALQALKLFGFDKKLISRSQRNSVNHSRQKLVREGLLGYEGGFLRLTVKGEKILKKIEAQNYKVNMPKKWDKKWRVIIFDIKEEKRGLRDKVRNTLVSIGFMCLQKSVWIYPYDCEDLINLIKADFKIGKDVLYMIVDRVENDRLIKEYFGLI